MKNWIQIFSMAALLLPASLWAATISGRVQVSGINGPGIPNASVVLWQNSSTGSIVDSARTGTDGTYTIANLASGDYTIVVSATGYSNANNDVSITTGSNGISNFVLVPSSFAAITGTVRGSGGQVISGALILLRRGSAAGAILDSVRTTATGVYLFNNVESGSPNYWISASADGYGTATNTNVPVGSGSTRTSNFTFSVTGIIALPSHSQAFRFTHAGDNLSVDLGVANAARSLQVYSLDGILRSQAAVPAGVSRVLIPGTFAPAKGYLFQVK